MTKRSSPPNVASDEAAAAERERREIQPGGPALHVLVELFGFGLGHVDPGGGEERMRLGIVQGERGGPQLEQLAVGTELREPEPNLRAPGEHKLRAGRHVGKQCDQGVQATVVLELVHIVEDEHERLGPRGERQRRDGGGHSSTRESSGPVSALNTAGSTVPSAFSASATYVRKTTGSLSRWSSETHANWRPSRAAHWARAVVLPYPGGATTLTKRPLLARESRSRTPVRCTRPGRGGGTVELGR